MAPKQTITAQSLADQYISAIHMAGHSLLAMEKEPAGGPVLIQINLNPAASLKGLSEAFTHVEQRNYLADTAELKAELTVLMGAHVAEKMLLGQEAGTGSADSVEQARALAEYILIRDIREHAETIGCPGSAEDKIAPLLQAAEADAREVLTRRHDDLVKVTGVLLEKGSLTRADLKALLATPAPDII